MSVIDFMAREANARLDILHRSGIKRAAEWMGYHAESLQRHVSDLSQTPEFETQAEEAMADAEETLTAALMVVKLARNAYQRKPKFEYTEAAE